MDFMFNRKIFWSIIIKVLFYEMTFLNFIGNGGKLINEIYSDLMYISVFLSTYL